MTVNRGRAFFISASNELFKPRVLYMRHVNEC